LDRWKAPLADHSVLGVHSRAFHQRQQVALHALARHVGPLHLAAAGDLVDLVQEHDAVGFDVGDRLQFQLVVVDQARGLLVHEGP
jgi:hypothetical protein